MAELVPGYLLRRGSSLECALLVKFMQRTYEELYPEENFAHLAQTVEQYFSSETPLWWAEIDPQQGQPQSNSLQQRNSSQQSSIISAQSLLGASARPTPIACLWMGTAVDQITGRNYPHIFLLYVIPEHRRQGIGSALMQHAESWAKARGDFQISLQVFQHNQPALQLYQKLGYQPQSILMVKPIQN